MQLTEQQLKQIAVFGIAGNFAEHLGQAGEDADFVNIETKEIGAPKGIFPIYLPGDSSFLGNFPLSNQKLLADFSNPIKVQMEPELCILFNAEYDDDHFLTQLNPIAFAAFNDCTIRRPNATKLSQKKNWGAHSTGISNHWIDIDQFETGGALDRFHIASYLKRDGQIHSYGIDSPVVNYSYFYQPLQQWMLETFNTQTDFGPLENLRNLLSKTQYPKQLIITLGATRYSEYGESTFLAPNDQLGVFIYNADLIKPEDLMTHFNDKPFAENFAKGQVSDLIQTVADK